ncbi:hypothetical protein M9H77_26451 [Catharanthus roseus]|uniref:Uncharacterized protein n=1 Tax=Catharanthus roseus TaxID=4058 RepID=A0ACC0A9R6_CATRO|nr:hypothetical protein M9H77_26451 [Catharanthus roseus]
MLIIIKITSNNALRANKIVRPGAHRTGRVEGRAVIVSSRGVRGRPSISKIPSTPARLRLGIYYDLGAPSGADYGATDYGNLSSNAGLGRTWSNEAVRVGSLHIHGSEDDKDEPEDNGGDDGDGDGDDDKPVPVAHASSFGHRPAPGPADGGPQVPVLVPSYSGHITGSIWRRQVRDILKSRSRYVSLTDWTPSDPAIVQLTEETGLSHLSLLFTDKNGNIVSGKLWPLVKNVRSVGLDIPVFSYICTNGETGSEVVKNIHPEVCDVGTQNRAQINRLTHSFRHDECRRGQMDSVQIR